MRSPEKGEEIGSAADGDAFFVLIVRRGSPASRDRSAPLAVVILAVVAVLAVASSPSPC
jgi:hypothetical protein